MEENPDTLNKEHEEVKHDALLESEIIDESVPSDHTNEAAEIHDLSVVEEDVVEEAEEASSSNTSNTKEESDKKVDDKITSEDPSLSTSSGGSNQKPVEFEVNSNESKSFAPKRPEGRPNQSNTRRASLLRRISLTSNKVHPA